MTVNFEGKKIVAYEGDSVASALYASGMRIFSRSFKYHRPRGLLCASGRCPNCMVNVDGVPNVPACGTPVHDGMDVKHQNAWPSLDTDVFSGIQLLDRFLPVGFYYKTFINFPIEWNVVEKPIRRVAGQGTVKDELAKWRSGKMEHEEFDKQYLHADLVVIGGGPAGTWAALEGARSGLKVLLVDDQPALGGHLRFSTDTVDLGGIDGAAQFTGLKGHEVAKKLNESAHNQKNLTVLSEAVAFGLYESNQVGVAQGKKLVKLRGRHVIVATGAGEYLTIFHNNDLPGVMLGTAAKRLISLYGVKPGNVAVVATNNPSGLSLAKALIGAGTKVVAYVDARSGIDPTSDEFAALRSAGVPILAGYVVKEAEGGKRVEGAEVIFLDPKNLPVPGSEKRFACDTICLANGFEPDTALLTQARCKTTYDELLGEFVPSEHAGSIHSAGDVTGIHDLGCTLLQASAAALGVAADQQGQAASQRLLGISGALGAREKSYREKLAALGVPQVIAIPGLDSQGRMKGMACVCHDVPEKDLVQAIYEGFDEVEILKRYSTYTMGPCEGKMCSMAGMAVCARETHRSVAETGKTVARPPYLPVAMGALAGRELHPIKLTAMHYKHLELGATIMDMGEWKRPHVYDTVWTEYDAVRDHVGIIDLSTLGRLDVKGKDAPVLLDFVYTHAMSKLQPGKSRYGVICDDAGIILDDGTVTRLSDSHYFITTSTGNIDFVEQWLTWWAVAKKYDVQVTNLTSGFAAVNVAGPKARDLLRKLTTVDLSTERFPYMAAAAGLVAGVPCVMLRIGFVGETGWEIHFPSEYGEYFWDTLLKAGAEFGIKPFGVETQRVLRLEKKHVIVGQDTDALSNPYEADMAWVVKLDKPDFVGKAALTFAKDEPGQRKLVGFIMQGDVVPHDGDQAFSADGSTLIGFVSSSRFSPAKGTGVGLALVRADLASEGGTIGIVSAGDLHKATMTFVPFYDPDGKRLKA